MSLQPKPKILSVDEYLNFEQSSDTKNEFIDGKIYAMAGASANHERISVNVLSEFRSHLKNSPCEPFGSDMKLRINSNFFYPDAIVDCKFDNSEPYFTTTPILIVEVLSKATRKVDETLKLLAYINIPTLQEYLLIEQDIVDITVLRRSENWLPKHYFLGDEITFESIGLTLPVEELYHRVDNDDMRGFTKNPP